MHHARAPYTGTRRNQTRPYTRKPVHPHTRAPFTPVHTYPGRTPVHLPLPGALLNTLATLNATSPMALSKLSQDLYHLFDKKEYDQCLKVLTPVKIELIKHNLLVPLPLNTKSSDQINDLKIAERLLEIGAFSLLLSNEYSIFENYFLSLTPFYSSSKLHSQGEVNTDRTKVIALNLLYLLSQGLTLRFHIELESIFSSPLVDVEKDLFLRYPVEFERNLMEGNYLKAWKLLQNDSLVPCTEFSHFKESLVTTLRYEIARSLEKTNASIPISNCKTLLYYPQESSDSAFETLVKELLDAGHWNFEPPVVHFVTEQKSHSVSDNSAIIKNVLSYAEQIESIV